MSLFDPIRKSGQPITFSKAIIHFVLISCLGLITGVLIKLLDLYTTNIGNLFTNICLDFYLHIDFCIQLFCCAGLS